MKNKPLMVVFIIIILSGFTFWLMYGDRTTVKATIGGEVCAVKAVGDSVREGDPLVRVKTATGNAVTARALVNGKIHEVKIRIGEYIVPKTPVIVIKEQ